jgi:hypothetical protein
MSVQSHIPRLEALLSRAIALGCTGAIIGVGVDHVLSLSAWDGTRLLGHLHMELVDGEEKWNLSTQCYALTGIASQAEWLTEGAKRVREVFTALVAS